MVIERYFGSEWYIALGFRMEKGVKTNVLLYENKVVHYDAQTGDSIATHMDMEIGSLAKKGPKQWAPEYDYIRLTRSRLQPSSNSSGFVLAFDMPDSIL